MYLVIDLTDGMTVFQGSEPECQEWVATQADYFTYHIEPAFVTPKEENPLTIL